MHRRAFLQSAGALSAGGASWYAYERGVFSAGDGPAYEPWENWRGAGQEGPLALIRAAILAASPHNTQPWRFKAGGSFIELYIDRQRNVGALDPYLREEHIGMGCALENLLLAARANGYAATAAAMPGSLSALEANEPQLHLVARVELTPAPRAESELYRAIPHRHTNRGVFDARRPIEPDFVRELSALGGERSRLFLFTEEAARRKIAQIGAAANDELYSDPRVEEASARWIRLPRKDVDKFRDGLTIDGFGLPPAAAAIAKALPVSVVSAMIPKGQKEGYAERMLTAPLAGIIAVRDRYDSAQCLEAGRLWQRAHLLATARGVAARPSNEAAEMVDYERRQGRAANCLAQLGEITGDRTWQPTFVFLMGYPTLTAHASPRRPVEEVLNA